MTELARSALEELAGAFLSGFDAGADFGACCTPDVSYEDPLAVQPLAGVDALERHAARLRKAVPDLRLERTSSALGDGRYACVPWRLAGTHRGEVGVLPATDRALTLHGLHYLELSDGLVRRARGFFDLYDASVQLGLLPARGGLGEAALLLVRGFGLRR